MSYRASEGTPMLGRPQGVQNAVDNTGGNPKIKRKIKYKCAHLGEILREYSKDPPGDYLNYIVQKVLSSGE